MNNRDLERLHDARAKHLLRKARPRRGESWSVEHVLAYCQGRAWDCSAVAVGVVGGAGEGRRQCKISAGLLAMIAELQACLAVLEEET